MHDFLKNMTTTDSLIDHSIEECGQCFHMYCMAETARQMIKEGLDTESLNKVMTIWDSRAKDMWREGKFFKLWEAERAAGRNPQEEFKKRGWES